MGTTLENIAKALRQTPEATGPRVKMRVDSATLNQVIGGTVVPLGDHVSEFAEADVKAVEAYVETERDIAAARERLERYEAAIERKKNGEAVPDNALPRFPLSLAACFVELHGREMRPFLSATRLDATAKAEKRTA
jgi:hypothetical protein